MVFFDRQKYYDYLNSKKWKAIRHLIAKRDNYKCVICDKRCSDLKTLHGFQVHHTTYDNLFNEQKHLEDLQFLCEDCHSSITHFKSKKKIVKTKKQQKFDNNIETIISRYNKTKTLINKFKVICRYSEDNNVRNIIQESMDLMIEKIQKLQTISILSNSQISTINIQNIKNLNFRCKYCKNTTYKIKRHQVNVGLYCDKCGKWHKFFTKEEIKKFNLL